MNRPSYLKRLWGEGVLTVWLGAAWTLVGVVQFFRDELFKQDWKFGPYILQLGGWRWVAILLVCLLLWLFEASFRLYRREVAETERLTDELKSKIRLSYATSAATHSSGVGQPVKLVFCVSVENIGNVRLTDCHVRSQSRKVAMRESDTVRLHAWQDCCPPFNLVLGDRTLIPVMAIENPYQNPDPDISMVAVQQRSDGTWKDFDVMVILPKSQRFIVWVEALSAESRPARISLDVWYDKSWQTRVRP